MRQAKDAPKDAPPRLDIPRRRDQGAPTRLTTKSGTHSDQNPTFSPDGRFILFTRFLKGYNRRPSELHRVEISSGNERLIIASLKSSDNVNTPGRSWTAGKICWSSDRAGKADEIYVANADGSAIEQITTHPESEGYYDEPVFLPNNPRILLFEAAPSHGPHAIALVERDQGGRITILTGDPDFDDRLPATTNSGMQILFQRTPTGSSAWRIYTGTLDLTGTRPQLRNIKKLPQPSAHNTDNSWFSNDRFILSSSDYLSPMPNIYAFPTQGGQIVRVTRSSQDEHGAPSSSPDGAWIAYEAHRGQDENKPSRIWIVHAPFPLTL